jgi:hypothetical protein
LDLNNRIKLKKFSGCSKQSVSPYLDNFLNGMMRNINKVINFPLYDINWCRRTSNQFELLGSGGFLSGCIGIIDCTHVRLIKPTIEGNAYFGKSGKDASINVQVSIYFNFDYQFSKFYFLGSSWP